MPATQRGIYHNLRESEYTASNGEVVFFFSSTLYLNKFLNGYETHREHFLKRFAKIVVENRYNMKTLADIQYYLSIEKRGFFVLFKGLSISRSELFHYTLRKMMETETPEWEQIKRPGVKERLNMIE